jgi:methionyl aminopeptidase
VRIVYKSRDEIYGMRETALVVARILDELCAAVAPGISTWELDRIARAGIKREGVTSAFLGYASPPYPAVTCISVNEEIVHGIPRKDRRSCARATWSGSTSACSRPICAPTRPGP